MGLPPSFASGSDLRNISQLCRDCPCSTDFETQTDINRQLAKFNVALKECREHVFRMSLIRLFGDELDTTRNKFPGKWAVETELQFLGAKMFLYSFSFRSRNHSLETSSSTTASELSSAVHVLLYEVMGVAAKIIYLFSELLHRNDEDSPGDPHKPPPQIFFPKHYIFTLCYACLVLYHFLEVEGANQVPQIEQDLALNHIGFVHAILVRCGVENNAEASRLADWLKLISKWNRSKRVAPYVTSRLGASLFYEGILKSATLKAESGDRSRAADLTRSFDEDQRKDIAEDATTTVRPQTQETQPQSSEWLMPLATNDTQHQQQQQQQRLVGDSDELYSWQGWEDQLQGWDLSMLSGIDFSMGVDDAGIAAFNWGL